jgi:hypothetical protein
MSCTAGRHSTLGNQAPDASTSARAPTQRLDGNLDAAIDPRLTPPLDGSLDAALPPARDTGLPRGLDAAPDSSNTTPDAGPPPHATSKYCGDAIRNPVLEECDDGLAGAGQSCTADCPSDDDAGVPAGAHRTLGTGPHVAAGTDRDMVLVHTEVELGTRVWLQVFSAAGALVDAPIDVSAGTAPVNGRDALATKAQRSRGRQ